MQALSFRQIGPGKYQANAQVQETGAHFASVSVGMNNSIVREGFTVGYSDEYRIDHQAPQRLKTLAGLRPDGGQPGQMQVLSSKENSLATIDRFRRDLDSIPAESVVWPLIVLISSILLLIDVANRRVAWTGRAPLMCAERGNSISSSEASAVGPKPFNSSAVPVAMNDDARQSLPTRNA